MLDLTGIGGDFARSILIRDFDEWVRMDFEYIDNWSLGLDIRILLRTVGAVLKGGGL